MGTRIARWWGQWCEWGNLLICFMLLVLLCLMVQWKQQKGRQ